MSDVRALLKAKRQEGRVTHPLASYTSNDQLRCVLCHSIVKNSSAWEGHLGSKSHRSKLVGTKEPGRISEGKRMDGAHYEEQTALRRAAVPSDNYEVELKKRRLDGVKPVTYETNLDNLPGDFISNTSRVPPPSPPGDPAVDSTDATDASSVKRTAVDLEWENFQQTVLGAPRREDLFERATISAAPDVSDVSQGFPSSLGDTNLARISDRLEGEIDRERRERDEKELIMDRLFDEEQAQEEADTKVVVMKGRLTALKNRRRAAKDARQKISLQ